MKLVVCTHNDHKAREIGDLLPDTFSVSTLDDGAPEPVEDGRTFMANAYIKARAAREANADAWLMADDSGLVVDFLVGEPGIRSSRYAGDDATDEDNNRKLLGEMGGVPAAERQAKFVCAIVLIAPDGTEHTFRGEVHGHIADAPAGTNGFGYDPLFIPDGHEQTFGELGDDVKASMSHRANAVRAMLDSAPWD